MTRVLFFGTHPYCYNGYCIVTYNLAKEMAKHPDIDFTIYGFQNFYNDEAHRKERTVPDNVYIYDAWANETPKHMGFGFEQIIDFVTMNKPDVIVIYNDMVVVGNVLNKLKEIPNKSFKVMVYMDQVYLHQKKDYIRRLNEQVDFVMCFTPYWEDILKGLGVTKPTGYLRHGFDPMVNYQVPKPLARQYYSLKQEHFVILNLNRNQPRKRWDTCLQAFAELVSRHRGENVKLLIATSMTGAWNLMEVYERELNKRGIAIEEGMKHLILIDNPQKLTDEEINILYNVADVGINTCDGEGFGLCNFQQAAIGIPQVVPYIGGFRDFFDKECAMVVEPKMTFYVDGGRDGVGGEAQLSDWKDIADALDTYYKDAELRKRHGDLCRKKILENYGWPKIGNEFIENMKRVLPAAPVAAIDTEKLKKKVVKKKDIKRKLRSKLTAAL